jgi:cation:H+ antiporter
MPTPLAALLFTGSLATTLVAARLFARRLDRLGVRFRFPEALVGLLTALAADGPELSSALFALIRGAHATGVGVLVGSNAFNLAAMIGVSALLVGAVTVRRRTLALEGCVGVGITLIAVAVLLHWISPVLAAAIAAIVIVPYLGLVIGAEVVPSRLSQAHFLPRLIDELERRPRPQSLPRAAEDPTHHLVGLIVLDVALIVAGSAGMVHAAIVLGNRWDIPGSVLGVVILAPLTSLPNAITAIRLGLAGRGGALIAETFNSNTINLLAGVIAPALFLSLGVVSATAKLELATLVAMTLLTVLLLARRHGVRRPEGLSLVFVYAGFVVLQLVRPGGG